MAEVAARTEAQTEVSKLLLSFEMAQQDKQRGQPLGDLFYAEARIAL